MDTLTGPPPKNTEEDSEPSESAEPQGPDGFDAESIATADTLPGAGNPPPRKAPSNHPPPPPTLRARAAAHEGRPLSVQGEPRLARDLMTRHLLTIGPDDPIMMLEQHMEAFRFRHLPVVEGDILIGIISHSDLLHASSSRLSKSAGEENVILHRLPAWCVMREDVVTVRPTEPLERVAALLWETRVGCIPVTEEDGRLVGIITEGDFVRLTHHFLTTAEPRYPESEPVEERSTDDIVRH